MINYALVSGKFPDQQIVGVYPLKIRAEENAKFVDRAKIFEIETSQTGRTPLKSWLKLLVELGYAEEKK